MALVRQEPHDGDPASALALVRSRRHRMLGHDALAYARATDAVLTCDEAGAELDAAEACGASYEDEKLPYSAPPPSLQREELALAWMDERDVLAQRAAMLRGWVSGQELPSLSGRRIETVVGALENVLRAMDRLTFDAAASSEATLLGRSDTLDALTREAHALVDLVLAELEELALDHEARFDRDDDDASYDPSWRAAGRSFAEHARMHVLAYVEPHVLALESRCRRGRAHDMLMLARVASSAAWVRRAIVQLSRALAPVTR